MKKRILSLLLVFVMVLGMLPTVAMAEETNAVSEESDSASVTVSLSLSRDAEFMVGNETPDVMAFKEITVPYFDLANYGLEEYYFVSESYGSDGSGGPSSDLEPGTAEFAYGKVTLLHLYIYALERFYCGVEEEDAGKGYLYENDLIGTEVFTISGGNGSAYMDQFWGGSCNLNYYVNYEYPLASGGWGATCDQILLREGDMVTLGNFSDWSFYSDPYSIFNYIRVGEDVVNTTVSKGEQVTLCVYVAGASMGTGEGTAQTPVMETCPMEAPVVYYVPADDASADVSTWNEIGAVDENGEVVFDTRDLEPGEYLVCVPGQPGANTDEICSTPGGIILTVEAPACAHENWNAATCTTPKTCANCGATEGDADPEAHSYVNGTCEHCGAADPSVIPFAVTAPVKSEAYTFAGDPSVKSGEDYEFTVEPEVGYRVTAVKVNDETISGINRKYKVEDVKSDLVITVETEIVELKPVTVRFEITQGTNKAYQYQNNGKIMVPQEVTVPYFDLALYDLECFYYNPDCYHFVSGGDSNMNANRGTQTAGTAATAYGVVTTMHVFIWTTEVFYCGLDPEDAGKGHLQKYGLLGAEQRGEYTTDQDYDIYYTGGVGSTYMYFLDHGSNLNYYLNFAYPLGHPGWGSTADQQALKDGDIISAHLIESSYASGSGFQYLKVKGEEGPVQEVTVKQGEEFDLELYSTTYGSNYQTVVQKTEGEWEFLAYVEEENLSSIIYDYDNPENEDAWVDPYSDEGIEFICALTGDMFWADFETGDMHITTENIDPGTYYLAVGGSEGSVEYGAAIFKLTVVCEHSWDAATCTAPKTCSKCGETEGKELGHTEEAIPGKAATCTATGLTEGKKCTVCGEVLVAQEEIAKLAHTEETIPGKAATCTETGLTEGKKCSVCGEVTVAQEEIAQLAHTEEAIPAKAATCTETGLTEGKKCTVCGEVLVAQEVVRKIAHTTDKVPAQAATTSAVGNVEHWKCSVCEKLFKDEAGTVETTLEAVTLPMLDENDKPIVIIPSKPAIKPVVKPAAPKMTFSDVTKADWFYDSVKEAYENGLIDGMSATTFDPNGKLTIAQAIKLAAALHQLEKSGKVTLKNGSDVWYSSYVDYAIANDIIGKSYGELTEAQMNAAATRSEFVAIFHGAKDFYAEKNTVADNAIPDVKMTDKNAAEIYEFYRAGILTGNDEAGTFAPDSSIKRSEVAAILIRMFDVSARQSVSLK